MARPAHLRQAETGVRLSRESLGELISVVTYRPWAGAFSIEFLDEVQHAAHEAGGVELFERHRCRGENALVVRELDSEATPCPS